MSKAPDERVAQDIQDGVSIHVTSTPVLLINGIPLLGDADDKTLRFVIASELDARR
jgi:protein-disulfide isomerase